jgi:hypothetical protein
MPLTVLNPVSRKVENAGASAPRLAALAGKQVGLYWNHKPGGDAALQRVDALLKSRFAGVRTKHYVGSMGGAVKSATKEDVAVMVAECAAVVGTTAD